ncbi:SAM-dependent methyltransferase [Variovorax paradoxus]|uniref:class I SAM-dependent methyltransferase n=1 Tax=Variovorax paradoxus TaxID=34073 RepID=UPI00278F9A9C|nr:class I SAM-dependent methyltransferase [Variovorax paradoxus]MDQ0569989.1 SAM-dependent methyltransferase [Variovorax paradoxus]
MTEVNYNQLSREAWNEAAPIHWRVTETLLREIKDPTRRDIHDVQIAELDRIGVHGASVAQLNCNNGRELITIKRMGAGRCVGFDISDEFVSQARQLNEAAGLDCEFVSSDVYDIGPEFAGQFDVVVVTAGALCFMPDLPRYFAIARSLLNKDGVLTIYEAHPLTRMFLKDRDRKGEPLQFVRSYFESDPVLHTAGLDYQGGTTYEAKPIYYFQYKLSDILRAFTQAGFLIDNFEEHDRDPSQSRQSLESLAAKPPLSYILTGSLQRTH